MSEFETVAASEFHTAVPGPAGDPNAPGQPTTLEVSKPRSATQDAWRELRRRPMFWFAIAITLIVLIMAIVPQLFTGADPHNCLLSRKDADPSGGAIFGFNTQGCDLWAQAVYSARSSLKIGFLSALLAGALAMVLGLVAGYVGRWADAFISRVMDIVLGLPLLLAAIVLMKRVDNANAGEGVRILAMVAVFGGLGWVTASRVIRSSVITAKNQDYVSAAKMLGAGSGRIMWRHILPNALAPFLVVITIALGAFISGEAALSFLGVGLKQPSLTWGIMISDGAPYFRTNARNVMVPSAFLALTVLAFIILGDTIREAFDPKLR